MTIRSVDDECSICYRSPQPIEPTSLPAALRELDLRGSSSQDQRTSSALSSARRTSRDGMDPAHARRWAGLVATGMFSSRWMCCWDVAVQTITSWSRVVVQHWQVLFLCTLSHTSTHHARPCKSIRQSAGTVACLLVRAEALMLAMGHRVDLLAHHASQPVLAMERRHLVS